MKTISQRFNNKTFWVTDPGKKPRQIMVGGRIHWALASLIAAGDDGCTPIDTPGPRWSHYVWVLRHEHSVCIETINEQHGGPFSGTHARYVLRSVVEPAPEVAA
ncbi:hypothetical protein Q5Y75_07955 [Ruegeria sp. 2205SS24-7]|uniref:winged helix domain-containing protein n=1 Tax=Ruegeria discodermiae TaxID=3064389 RepID=UPI00274181E8|nr:hypothetical protein [Ruegeria sp. 2205SS24-7]MDP5217147.1 hypothetical protein [Ruegeria sp. 2205SS24-7]